MKLWASIPLRIALASVFISHALQKIFGIFDGIGIFVFSRNLADLGFSPSLVWAYAIGYAELIAGIFIIIGFCSRICSCVMFVVIFGAIVKFQFIRGFFLTTGGYEYSFVLLAVCSALIIQGPGPFSLTSDL